MLNCEIHDLNKENYNVKKSILRNALIRIDYDDLLELDSDLIFQMEQYLTPIGFKFKKESNLADVQVEIKEALDPEKINNLPITFYKTRTVYTFEHTDEKMHLSLVISPIFCWVGQHGSFVKNEPEYVGFNKLSEILINILDIINIKKPLNYKRIGIRKINSIFTKQKNKLKSNFTPMLIKNLEFFPSKILEKDNPQINQVFNFALNDLKVNLRTLLQIVLLVAPNGKPTNVYNFNFDIDTYLINKNNELSHNNLKQIFKKANNTLFSVFLWCLSKEARQKLIDNDNLTEITL